MYYQIRDLYSGRKLLQTDSPTAVFKYLESRNAATYEVWGLDAPSGEVRWVQNGQKWLSEDQVKAARPEVPNG